MASSSPSAFVASLPELSEGARSRRSKKQANAGTVYKFFRHQEKTVLCKWNGKAWTVFGEVPAAALTREQADKIIASVAARDSGGGGGAGGGSVVPVPAVPETEVAAALDAVAAFAEAFRSVDRAEFAFDPSHDEHLAKADVATETLWNAARASPAALFARVFPSPNDAGASVSASASASASVGVSAGVGAEAGAVEGGGGAGGGGSSSGGSSQDEGTSVVGVCAEVISLVTSSIENMVKLDKSMYSSDVLVRCGKVRLQLLRTLQCIASNEAATKHIVGLAHARQVGVGASSDRDGGDSDNDGGGAVAPSGHSLEGAVVGVLRAVSAKFDFVAVQVATNLLRNWALYPDGDFRRRLIQHHCAMSALVNLFAHKDANVAGTAIATLRHVCSTREGNAVQYLQEDDIVKMQEFSQVDPAKVHPVVRVEFGRLACILIAQATTLGSQESVSDELAHRLAGLVHRLASPSCLVSIVFLLAGPHRELYAEVVACFKALGWISASGDLDAKLDSLKVSVQGQPMAVSARLRALGMFVPSPSPKVAAAAAPSP